MRQLGGGGVYSSIMRHPGDKGQLISGPAEVPGGPHVPSILLPSLQE